MAWVYSALLLWGLIEIAEAVAPLAGPDAQGCRLGFVYDGDTAELICDGQSERARLVGFDTPEAGSPGCPEEAELAQAATRELRQHLSAGEVTLNREGRDKYGRPLLRVAVDGQDVADHMTGQGLAVRYGGEQRIDWCARIERQDRDE